MGDYSTNIQSQLELRDRVVKCEGLVQVSLPVGPGHLAQAQNKVRMEIKWEIMPKTGILHIFTVNLFWARGLQHFRFGFCKKQQTCCHSLVLL